MFPALRASGARNGRGENQIGGEQPQMPVSRVMVEQSERGHDRVERQRAGMVTHDESAPVIGNVLQAAHLDPEPLVVERPEGRGEHVVGQVGVEAEVIDLVFTGDAATQERQRPSELALPLGLGTRIAPAPSRARARPPAAGARTAWPHRRSE